VFPKNPFRNTCVVALWVLADYDDDDDEREEEEEEEEGRVKINKRW